MPQPNLSPSRNKAVVSTINGICTTVNQQEVFIEVAAFTEFFLVQKSNPETANANTWHSKAQLKMLLFFLVGKVIAEKS